MALCGVGMRFRACEGAALTDQGASFVRGAELGWVVGARHPYLLDRPREATRRGAGLPGREHSLHGRGPHHGR